MKPPEDIKNLTSFHWIKNLFSQAEELTPEEVIELKQPIDGESAEWDEYVQMIIAGEDT